MDKVEYRKNQAFFARASIITLIVIVAINISQFTDSDVEYDPINLLVTILIQAGILGFFLYHTFDRKVLLTINEEGIFSDGVYLTWKVIENIGIDDKALYDAGGNYDSSQDYLIIKVNFSSEDREVPLGDIAETGEDILITANKFFTRFKQIKEN